MLIAFLFAPTSHLSDGFPASFLSVAYHGYKSLFCGEYVGRLELKFYINSGIIYISDSKFLNTLQDPSYRFYI